MRRGREEKKKGRRGERARHACRGAVWPCWLPLRGLGKGKKEKKKEKEGRGHCIRRLQERLQPYMSSNCCCPRCTTDRCAQQEKEGKKKKKERGEGGERECATSARCSKGRRRAWLGFERERLRRAVELYGLGAEEGGKKKERDRNGKGRTIMAIYYFGRRLPHFMLLIDATHRREGKKKKRREKEGKTGQRLHYLTVFGDPEGGGRCSSRPATRGKGKRRGGEGEEDRRTRAR